LAAFIRVFFLLKVPSNAYTPGDLEYGRLALRSGAKALPPIYLRREFDGSRWHFHVRVKKAD
jgi:hypothetical protein